MKKQAKTGAKPRARKGAMKDLEPKADPKGGTVQLQGLQFTQKVNKASPVIYEVEEIK